MAVLTNTSVNKLPAPEGAKSFHFDDHRDAPRGFGVKVTKAGAKSFILRYNFDGKVRLKVIGAHPTWSIEQAREEAKKLRRQIDAGTDPLEAQKARREADTVASLAEKWVAAHASKLKSARDVEGSLRNTILPVLGGKKLADVRRAEIVQMIAAKAETAPREALRVLSFVRQMFNYALDRELVTTNPATGVRTPKGAINSRERVLSDNEIKAFWSNVESSGMSRLTALALKLILTTGQRPGEVAGMRWAEVEGDLWTIPAARRKTGRAHEVHLSGVALSILGEAKAEADRLAQRRADWAANDFVFPASRGGLTVLALSRAVARKAEVLGMNEPGWTPHDLRRSCRTGLGRIGVAPHVAEIVIGHAQRGITAVYDRHSYAKETAQALDNWANYLMELVSPNIVSLDARRAASQ